MKQINIEALATVGQMFAIIGICIVLFGCLIILVAWILGKVI